MLWKNSSRCIMKNKEFSKKIVIVICALVLSILLIASVWPSMFYKENEVFGLSDIGVDYTSGCIYEDGVFMLSQFLRLVY